jgi:hypothetical protein
MWNVAARSYGSRGGTATARRCCDERGFGEKGSNAHNPRGNTFLKVIGDPAINLSFDGLHSTSSARVAPLMPRLYCGAR